MKKILLVDDNEANITLLLGVLDELYDLSVALSGEDALEAIEEEMPDLVILDLRLGGISGIEVCKIIKQNEATKHIPIIMLTATSNTLQDEVYAAGADSLMSKPFEIAFLLNETRKLLNKDAVYKE
ncbi:MAG: response regulator [Epsilonproteobacteria bacterium]|nr:MAG: response regulator [Campylobacterota bacterium]